MTTELIIIIIACILIYASIRLRKSNLHLLNVGIRTIGKVVSTRFERSTGNEDNAGERKGVYYSTVQFSTEDNQTISIELNMATNKEDAIGTEKQIIYDPKFPEKAQLNNHFILVILPWLLFGTGILGVLWMLLELFEVTNFLK